MILKDDSFKIIPQGSKYPSEQMGIYVAVHACNDSANKLHMILSCHNSSSSSNLCFISRYGIKLLSNGDADPGDVSSVRR